MRLLFVGGTGVISSECAALASSRGHDLTLVTRGSSAALPPPPAVRVLTADAHDPDGLRAVLTHDASGVRYDAVVQFVGYEPGHAADDVVTFAPRASQYIFISTAAAYYPADRLTVMREDSPQANAHWEYARKKIEFERELRMYAEAADLPITIVRPAHTYGPTKIPAYVGNSAHPWTLIDRMRRGADVIVPGDGTSLWTLTHARDVAVGIVGLCGNEAAYGEAVNATSDIALTWESIYSTIAEEAGVPAKRFSEQVLHVPTDALVAADPRVEGGTRGDKMRCLLVNNAKMHALVPEWGPSISLGEGMRESIAWFEAEPSRQVVDKAANDYLDRIAVIYRAALAKAAG